jgi:hypothetical protein
VQEVAAFRRDADRAGMLQPLEQPSMAEGVAASGICRSQANQLGPPS